MEHDQENVLNKYTDEVFRVVAACFADGEGSKKAKANVKESLRQVWHAARHRANLEYGGRLRTIGDKITDGKW